MFLIPVLTNEIEKVIRTEIVYNESAVLKKARTKSAPLEFYLSGDRGRGFDPENAYNLYLQQKLKSLFNKWEAETAYFSSVDMILKNDSYNQIVSYGDRMIQPILSQLEIEPSYLVWALNWITKSKISDKALNIEEASKLWVKWGKDHNFI